MKRIIFGVLAVVIAAGAVAFTTPSDNRGTLDDFTFYYIPPVADDYSLTSVEDVANWKTTPAPVLPCTGGSDRACSIVVNEANTTGVDELRALQFELHAIEGAGMDEDFVPDLSTTSEIISGVNKP
jgi:hypothetical protein